MNILVLNCGSSSVKYKLIEIKNNVTLAEGGVEKIGLPDAFLKYKQSDGNKVIVALNITDHKGAIAAILSNLTDSEVGCIKSFARECVCIVRIHPFVFNGYTIHHIICIRVFANT